MPWIPIAALAAAGLAKSEFVDKPKEERQRKLAAETQRYSPWTHLTADPVQEADPVGATIAGATTGAMFGQGLKESEAAADKDEAMAQYYGQGGYGSRANTYASPAPSYTDSLELNGPLGNKPKVNSWKLYS